MFVIVDLLKFESDRGKLFSIDVLEGLCENDYLLIMAGPEICTIQKNMTKTVFLKSTLYKKI